MNFEVAARQPLLPVEIGPDYLDRPLPFDLFNLKTAVEEMKFAGKSGRLRDQR
jgi:hypothetical protein